MRLSPGIERSSPTWFALVMATGIVSVAAYDHEYWRLVAFIGFASGFCPLGSQPA